MSKRTSQISQPIQIQSPRQIQSQNGKELSPEEQRKISNQRLINQTHLRFYNDIELIKHGNDEILSKVLKRKKNILRRYLT